MWPTLSRIIVLSLICFWLPRGSAVAAEVKKKAPVMSAQAWHDKGEEALKQKNYARAIECFREATALEPTVWPHLKQLLAASVKSGNFGGGTDLKEHLRDHTRKGIANFLLPNFAKTVELNDMGLAYESLKLYPQAVVCYRKSLEVDTRNNDHEDAITYDNMGDALYQLNRNTEAIEAYLAALVRWRKLKKRSGEAEALVGIGMALEDMGKPQEANARYNEALPIYREIKDQAGEAMALRYIADALDDLDRRSEAATIYEQSAALYRKVRDATGEAKVLRSLGNMLENLDRYPEAQKNYERALALARQEDEHDLQVTLLLDLGDLCHYRKEYEGAEKFYRDGLKKAQEINDANQQGIAWEDLAHTVLARGDVAESQRCMARSIEIDLKLANYDSAIRGCRKLSRMMRFNRLLPEAENACKRGMSLVGQLRDRSVEALMCEEYARVFTAAYEYEKALALQDRACTIWRTTGNRASTAQALSERGETLELLSRYEESAKSFREALEEWRSITRPAVTKTKASASSTVQWLAADEEREGAAGRAQASYFHGLACERLGLLYEALRAYETSLATDLSGRDPLQEAKTRAMLASLYQNLGQNEKALALHAANVERARKSKSPQALALSLKHSAVALSKLGRKQEAAKALVEANNLKTDQYIGVANTGRLLLDLGLLADARKAFEQGLELYRTIRNRRTEFSLKSGLALLEERTGNVAAARALYQEVLMEAHRVKQRELEANTASSLADLEAQAGRQRLAIFWGKQAVGIYQSMRSGLVALPPDVQRAFVESRDRTYRFLAERLVATDRLPEAEQILRLLKEEEFLEFVKRDARQAPEYGVVALTPDETSWRQKYQAMTDALSPSPWRLEQLRLKATRTDAEEAEYVKLEIGAQVAEGRRSTFFEELQQQMNDSRVEAQEDSQQVQSWRASMARLRQEGEGESAVVYTLVGEKKLTAIVLTADGRKAFHHEIERAALNRKILQLRDVLYNSAADPVPLALELYRIVTCEGQVARELEAAGVQTVMWFLDGLLRYVPVTALHDGRDWFLARHRHVVITPSSTHAIERPRSPERKALGAGVSKKHVVSLPGPDGRMQEERFEALKSVEEELKGIVEDKDRGGHGVIPGRILLDGEFTAAAFKSHLAKDFRMVHIASHFSLTEGNEGSSFLLLGDGRPLTLRELSSWGGAFKNVDLLTLSACSTAVAGGQGDGREVDGLGEVAQRNGAAAVMATLWPVADVSTAQLMQEFYRNQAARAGTGKAAALQAAQLALLRGKTGAEEAGVSPKPLPAPPGRWERDPAHPFAHPYYWAPFVLIGNWR